MSKSEIKLRAEFSDSRKAQKIHSILNKAKDLIDTEDKDVFLHDYLDQEGLNHGINFDSWWYPQEIELTGSILHLHLIGSPSGTEEQDIITWLNLAGASSVSGDISIEGGSDATSSPISSTEDSTQAVKTKGKNSYRLELQEKARIKRLKEFNNLIKDNVIQMGEPQYHLRFKGIEVSKRKAQEIFKFDDNKRPLNYIKNIYVDNQDGTITDHATGLMWQKAVSEKLMPYSNAINYIKKLNTSKYAGFDDWRLPTIDEIFSIIENKTQYSYDNLNRSGKKIDDIYIDPIFDVDEHSIKDFNFYDYHSGYGIYSVDVTFTNSWAVGFNGQIYEAEPRTLDSLRAVRTQYKNKITISTNQNDEKMRKVEEKPISKDIKFKKF